MSTPEASTQWLIDARTMSSTELMSLDLARHLPRRLAIGPAVIVTEKPAVLLSVIRKRWLKIVREVATQRASTLDAQKRIALLHELDHMQRCQFTSKPFQDFPTADCFFLNATQLPHALPPCYPTLYLTTWMASDALYHAISKLPQHGHIIVYSDWSVGHQELLAATFEERFALDNH